MIRPGDAIRSHHLPKVLPDDDITEYKDDYDDDRYIPQQQTRSLHQRNNNQPLEKDMAWGTLSSRRTRSGVNYGT